MIILLSTLRFLLFILVLLYVLFQIFWLIFTYYNVPYNGIFLIFYWVKDWKTENFPLDFKTAAEIVYISESNENWEKYSTQRWTPFSALLIYVIGDKILLIKVLEN